MIEMATRQEIMKIALGVDTRIGLQEQYKQNLGFSKRDLKTPELLQTQNNQPTNPRRISRIAGKNCTWKPERNIPSQKPLK